MSSGRVVVYQIVAAFENDLSWSVRRRSSHEVTVGETSKSHLTTRMVSATWTTS